MCFKTRLTTQVIMEISHYVLLLEYTIYVENKKNSLVNATQVPGHSKEWN